MQDGKEMIFQFYETLGQEAFVCPKHTHVVAPTQQKGV